MAFIFVLDLSSETSLGSSGESACYNHIGSGTGGKVF